MMRRFVRLALVLSAVIGFSRSGNAQDFWSDYRTALSVFRAGEAELGKYQTSAFDKILDGIDGRWTSISALNPGLGDDAALQRACGLVVADAKRVSDFSFLLTRRSGKDLGSTLEHKYTLISANLFGFSADDRAVLKYFALDGPDAQLTLKLNVLRSANGVAELYRYGPDLLIVKVNFGQADIYARCK